VKPLDDLEQRATWAVAAIGVVMSVALNIHTLPFALIGFAMAGFMVFGAQRRSRFMVAAASWLLTFGPWHVALFGTPFIILGLWLIFRGRPSPEEIEARRQARDARVAEAKAARDAKRGGRTGGKGGQSSPSRGPAASKRYTPPGTRRR